MGIIIEISDNTIGGPDGDSNSDICNDNAIKIVREIGNRRSTNPAFLSGLFPLLSCFPVMIKYAAIASHDSNAIPIKD
ncbi:MAG: hypothetical protein ACMXYL_02950 [Candidatus Woesearchaeota archaeon]